MKKMRVFVACLIILIGMAVGASAVDILQSLGAATDPAFHRIGFIVANGKFAIAVAISLCFVAYFRLWSLLGVAKHDNEVVRQFIMFLIAIMAGLFCVILSPLYQ